MVARARKESSWLSDSVRIPMSEKKKLPASIDQ
jgi:hypothetical protein